MEEFRPTLHQRKLVFGTCPISADTDQSVFDKYDRRQQYCLYGKNGVYRSLMITVKALIRLDKILRCTLLYTCNWFSHAISYMCHVVKNVYWFIKPVKPVISMQVVYHVQSLFCPNKPIYTAVICVLASCLSQDMLSCGPSHFICLLSLILCHSTTCQ